MALLTTSGGLARVMGPLVFADVYQERGVIVVFGTLLCLLGLALVINLITYKRFKYAVDIWIPFEEEIAAQEAADLVYKNL